MFESSAPMTIEDVADELRVSPGLIRRLIREGDLKARQDNTISPRALQAFTKRQQRKTRRYFKLRSRGLPARQAWAQACATN